MNDGDTRARTLYSDIEYEVIRIFGMYKVSKQRLFYSKDYWGGNAAVKHCEVTHHRWKRIVRDTEQIKDRILEEKRRAALEAEEQNITIWDTYQNALKTENEVIVGFDRDIEKIVNRLCYSYFMRSVFTILRNSNNDNCQTTHWPITRASYGNCSPDEIYSVLCFGKDVYHSKCRLVYPCFESLRVLDLSLVKCLRGMPPEITDLVHLRYLALSTIGSLYKLQFLKLKNLQTLLVTSWIEKYPLQLPCDILGLRQLRHLHIDKRCSQYLPCLVQKNLQTLYWLKVVSSDRKPNFRMVPNLKELGIYIEGQLEPNYLGNLVHSHLLEKLKFEVGRVERFYLPTGFPPNLKKLTLRYTYLPWKEMDMIGKLSHLEVLKLKDFAFCGSKWEPSKHGFRKLKALLISRSNLKHWNASSINFPVLERLVLRYCWELKQVPLEFAKIGTLKLIILECCYSSLVTSALQISSAKKLLFKGMTDCPLRVRKVGIKVELPNNESFEEESVESSKEECLGSSKVALPINESFEEESYETAEEESDESSEEECVGRSKVELPNNESFDEESVKSSKEETVDKEESVKSCKQGSMDSSKEERLKSSKAESVGSFGALVLRYCSELKRLPFDFTNIGTLKLIVLEGCDSSLVISANKIEQKLLKREDLSLLFSCRFCPSLLSGPSGSAIICRRKEIALGNANNYLVIVWISQKLSYQRSRFGTRMKSMNASLMKMCHMSQHLFFQPFWESILARVSHKGLQQLLEMVMTDTDDLRKPPASHCEWLWDLLSKLGPPEMAGELGVIFNIPQPFTVRSKRLSQVIRISHHHFEQLLQPLSDDGEKILSNFRQHLRGLRKEELEEIPMVRELLGDPNNNEIIAEPEGPESKEGQKQQENRTFQTRVIIHDELKEEHRGKLVHLPDSIQELFSIAEKRFGKRGTKVLMANGSEVEDIESKKIGENAPSVCSSKAFFLFSIANHVNETTGIGRAPKNGI
nr:putative late blight resistance protein homolog R1B-17 [Ipomoea batatas]